MESSLALQQSYWTRWNEETRERRLTEVSFDQQRLVIDWLSRLDRTDLDILEVGCGAGWLCPSMKPFGRVTATDLSAAVVDRAAKRIPDVRFVSGDFMGLDFAIEGYDVVVSLEVLSHVADHSAFVGKVASLLRPGGVFILATQNRPVLERYNKVPPPQPGQLRRWFDRRELVDLLTPFVDVRELHVLTPIANRGVPRLVANRYVKRAMRAASGRLYDRVLTGMGLGWTLMLRAEKKSGQASP